MLFKPLLGQCSSGAHEHDLGIQGGRRSISTPVGPPRELEELTELQTAQRSDHVDGGLFNYRIFHHPAIPDVVSGGRRIRMVRVGCIAQPTKQVECKPLAERMGSKA